MTGRRQQLHPRTTIHDVARLAGVSTATVSRVLSDSRPVAPDIVTRVRAAATELDYRPSPAAQSLIRGSIPTVGVVVPDLANPYFAEVLKGVAAAAEADSQRTLVVDVGEDASQEAPLVRDLVRWSDGIVLCSPRMPAAELATLVRDVPRLVIVNGAAEGVPNVRVDFHAGMTAICEHLAELGHRHAAYLEGPAGAWSDGERRRAFGAATAHGLRVDCVPCGAESVDGHAALDAALATGATAIIAFSDYVALGVVMRAAEIGLAIPGDVSLVGFDDIPLAGIAGPGLTTAAVSKRELGRLAWQALRSGEPGVRWLEPRLVRRGSTAPPRSDAGRRPGRRARGRATPPSEGGPRAIAATHAAAPTPAPRR